MSLGAQELRGTKRPFRRVLRRHEKGGAAGLAYKSKGKKAGMCFQRN